MMKITTEAEFQFDSSSAKLSLVLTAHGDGSIFVVVVDDEVGTFGSIVHARRQSSLHGRETIDVATKLGDRGNQMPELWARMVLETCREEVRDLMFCFGVKKDFGRGGGEIAEAKALCGVLSEKVDELAGKRLPVPT
jgi:hypothetical protein